MKDLAEIKICLVELINYLVCQRAETWQILTVLPEGFVVEARAGNLPTAELVNGSSILDDLGSFHSQFEDCECDPI